MAVEQTGSSSLSDIYSESLSITVPSDAQLAIIVTKDYAIPTGTPAIGAQSSTLITRFGSINDRPACGIYYLVSPPTGSQTLYFGSSQGFTDSYYAGIVFYKGVNTATPIASYAINDENADITGLTASTGSMMFGVAAGSYSTPTVTDNGQTQLFLDSSHGFGTAQLADASAFYFSGTDLNAAAITIAPETISATALPRRALDGPFYNALKGSIR